VSWAIRYEREAERAIDALGPQVRRRTLLAIGNLAVDPRSAASVKPMKGSDRYRLRVGDWRVIYELHDEVMTVLVVRVGNRRDVYGRARRGACAILVR
jgi:mRNA interferase RelE/StbE